MDEDQQTQRINGGLFRSDAFDADEYAGETSIHYWIPDKSQPVKKVMLEIRDQALKGTDITSIVKRMREIGNSATAMEYQQSRLSHCKPPSREIDRLRVKIDKIKDSDFADDEEGTEGYQTAEDKAEEARVSLEAQITKLTEEWQDRYRKIESEIQQLLDLPSIYELFRSEMFVKVIADHSISWRHQKLDFSKPAREGEEPPISLMRGLYEFLQEVIGSEKKAKRKNTG